MTNRTESTGTAIAARSPSLPVFILFTSLAALSPARAATQIVFSGGAPGLSHYLSDGQTEIPTGAGFFFELGTFANGFVPTAENTDEWLENWRMVNDAEGVPDPGTRDEYDLVSSIFGPYGGFSSSVDLEHNNEPFEQGVQGFIWGYDNREEAGDAQWILLTNSGEWGFPSGISNQTPTQTWTLGTAEPSETVVGSLSGGSMTLESVTVSSPTPVPEPSTAVWVAVGLLVSVIPRRRRLPATPSRSGQN